ncbi:tRNA-specific adenosine deaminase [Candidatus Hepatincola sp. Pdp]
MLNSNPYMKILLEELKNTQNSNEVPVAALIIDNTTKDILTLTTNQSLKLHDATAHAEILAIRQACAIINNYRLTNHSLFVTLEPCPMCAGAILNARIPKLYFGAFDTKYGAIENKAKIFQQNYPHKIEVYGGICEQECQEVMQEFFQSKRA